MMRIRFASVVAGLALCAAIAAQDRSATITGRVLSAETGRPVAGARVSSNYADVGLSATTDAQGRYELRAPVPERYVVRASAPGYPTVAYGEEPGLGPLVISTAPGRGATGVDLSLSRGATIAGRVIDEAKEPVVKGSVHAAIDRWSFGERRFSPAARVETDDRGEFRLIGLPPGEYVVAAQDRTAVTFAPSAPSLKGARRFTVGRGQTIEGVTIQTRGGASGSINGQLTGYASRVELLPESPEIVLWPRSVDLRTGGQFRFDDVAPGRYWLVVRPGPAANQPKSWVRDTVVVGPGAETTRALTLSEGAAINGRVNGTAKPIRDLSLAPFDGTRNPEAGSVRIVVAGDGSFRATGLAPGRYRWLRTQEASFQLSIFESTSTLDIADLPLVVRAGDAPRQLRVEVTGRAIISGTITDRDGKPTTAGGVIVASTDSRYWTGVSRRLLVTRADQNGFFEVSRLPAGEYFVAHIGQLAPGQHWDPAFLKKTLAGAARVDVAAGAERSVSFRLK